MFFLCVTLILTYWTFDTEFVYNFAVSIGGSPEQVITIVDAEIYTLKYCEINVVLNFDIQKISSHHTNLYGGLQLSFLLQCWVTVQHTGNWVVFQRAAAWLRTVTWWCTLPHCVADKDETYKSGCVSDPESSSMAVCCRDCLCSLNILQCLCKHSVAVSWLHIHRDLLLPSCFQ